VNASAKKKTSAGPTKPIEPEPTLKADERAEPHGAVVAADVKQSEEMRQIQSLSELLEKGMISETEHGSLTAGVLKGV
jgi:hypothetical protein